MPLRIVSSLANNAEPRYPEGGGFYLSAWRDDGRIGQGEAKAALGELDKHLLPTPRGEIVIALTRLAAHFWSDREETQWAIIFDDYARELEQFPADILHEGIAQIRRRSKWWPKLSELIEVMEPHLTERRRQAERLAIIANRPARPAATPIHDVPSNDSVRRVSEIVRDIKAKMPGNENSHRHESWRDYEANPTPPASPEFASASVERLKQTPAGRAAIEDAERFAREKQKGVAHHGY